MHRYYSVGYFCCIARIVFGFERDENMPKLNFLGNLPKNIKNNILKLFVIQNVVQDGRQNVWFPTWPPKY